MNDFIMVINYFFSVLSQLFSLLTSNWFFGFILLTGIFALVIDLVLITKGTK